MKALKYLFTLVLLLTLSSTFAQAPTKSEAHKAYINAGNSKNETDLVIAKDLIDQVVVQEAYAKDAEVWLIRGFVYKDVFKSIDKGEPTSKSRLTSLESLYNAYRFDESKRYGDNSRQAYEYLTTTLFNDAARALNDLNDGLALALYNDYERAEKKMYPKKDLSAKEIEFKNALGTLYTKKMRQEKDLKWFHKATEVYEEVLQIDPDNYGANYNMATLYYNRGVQRIFEISPDFDIPKLKDIQVVSKEFFVQSLPYMLKAHELKPDRKETLIGLEGIYYSLQDDEKSEYYRGLFEALVNKDKRGLDKKDE